MNKSTLCIGLIKMGIEFFALKKEHVKYKQTRIEMRTYPI
jgi:hypothetical protein